MKTPNDIYNLPWSFRTWGNFIFYPSANLLIVYSDPVPEGKVWAMYRITAKFLLTGTGSLGSSFAEMTSGLYMIPPGLGNPRDLPIGTQNPGNQTLITPDFFNTLTITIPMSTVGGGQSQQPQIPTGNLGTEIVMFNSLSTDPYIFPPDWRVAGVLVSNAAPPGNYAQPSNASLYVQSAEVDSCY